MWRRLSSKAGDLTEPVHPPGLVKAFVVVAFDLQLPTIRARYEDVAVGALRDHASYKQFLANLLNSELAERTQRRKLRLVREAAFPRPKRLEDFDFAANPAVSQTRSWVGNFMIADSKGRNTLGLFLAISGFTRGFVSAPQDGGMPFIAADRHDLHALLCGHEALPDLLSRKKRHLGETGQPCEQSPARQASCIFCSAM